MSEKKLEIFKYLVTDYLSEKSLELNCSGLIINSFEYSCFPGIKFTKEKTLNIVKSIKSSDKVSILNCDKIIHENEINIYREYLLSFINEVDYIIYSDYSILTIIEEKYYDKLIYDPKTLVCSYNELNTLDTKAFISSELSMDELSEIVYNAKPNKLCINAFGYHQIMYSKRNLISLYNNHLGNKLLDRETIYDLKEEQREDLYKIVENDRGTFIYTHFIYALLENLNIIKDKVFMFRINSFLLDENIELIIDKYNALVFEKDIDRQKAIILDINKNFPNAKPGFLKDELYLLKNKN